MNVKHHTLKQLSITKEKMAYRKLLISRIFAENILVFLLQFTGLMLSVLPSHSPLWIASGGTLAFVYMRGLSILIGIWFGSLFAYYIASHEFSFSFFAACIHVLQALILFKLNKNYPTLIFNRLHLFFKFVLSCLMVASLAILALVILYEIDGSPITLMQGFKWFLANLFGTLIFSCSLITWDMYFPDIDELRKKTIFNFSLLLSLLIFILALLIFTSSFSNIILLNLFLLIIILSISKLFTWCGSIASLFVAGFFLTLSSYLNAPIFNLPNQVLLLQLLFAMDSLFALTFAIALKKINKDQI